VYRNVGNRLPPYTTLHPRRAKTSTKPRRKPEISYCETVVAGFKVRSRRSLGMRKQNNASHSACHRRPSLDIIIILIIGKDPISFMQGIYTYIPETNHVPKQYNVAAILSLLFMVPISLAPALALMYYISTFRSMCAVPNIAVFCSSLTSWFPGMVLTYFLNYYYYYYYYYYYILKAVELSLGGSSVRVQVELALWLSRCVFNNVRSDLIQGKAGEYGVGYNVGCTEGRWAWQESAFVHKDQRNMCQTSVPCCVSHFK
jgi:hypothetical protein